MGRLDDHGDTPWLQLGIDGVGDLSGHLLLDLQPLGISLDHTCQLGDADHTIVW